MWIPKGPALIRGNTVITSVIIMILLNLVYQKDISIQDASVMLIKKQWTNTKNKTHVGFTCWKSAMKIPKQWIKLVQSYQ